MEQNSSSIKFLAIAILVASVVIGVAIIYGNNSKPSTSIGGTAGRPSSSAGQPSQVPSQTANINDVNIADTPFIGQDSAPVVVAYWFDYQCPFCKRFEDAVAQIVQDYVNSGKIRIVFKNYQFLGPDSQTAGLASRAVWEIAPSKFYEWHKAMLEKQDAENGGWGSKADILALTESLGIDSNRVDQLMVSKAAEYQKAIDADKAEGVSFGINGTPGTIVGTQLISGAQEYTVVKRAIDSFLAGN